LTFRPRTKDDRGRAVDAIDDKRLRKEAEGRDSHRYQLALRLRAAVRGKSNEVTPLTVVVLVATVTCGILGVNLAPRDLRAITLVSIAVVGGSATLASTRSRIGTYLAASAVAEGVCGTCAYPLHGLSPEPDGCVVCAECGSAWSASRIVVSEHQRVPSPRVPLLQREFFSTKRARDMVPDDRGRFIRILDPRLRQLAPEVRTSLPSGEEAALRSELRRVGVVARRALALVAGLLTLFVLVRVLATSSRSTTAQKLATAGVTLVVGGGIIAGIRLAESDVSPARRREILLARGRCPSCGGGLGTASAQDGYVACRCGASWKAADIADGGVGARASMPS
jgi:hypothetical protein